MRTKIKHEELEAVTTYLQQNGGKVINPSLPGEPPSYESKSVFPVIVKLMKYAATEHPDQIAYRDMNYKHIAYQVEGNDMIMGTLVREAHSSIQGLIESYRSEENAEKKNNLFQTRISDMTGYEFQDYLKYIGVIK